MIVNYFFAVLLLLANIATYVHPQEIKSAIACEYDSMRIECNGNERLSIVGGNYGRKDGSVCKRENNNNCIGHNTVKILKERCDGRQSCLIAASNAIFGDPCVSVEKYLEVLYKCIPEINCGPGELKCADGKCVPNSRVCDGYKDCSGADDEINCSYRTAYGCKAGSLNIECREGEVIRVIKGNYGRTSNVICQRSAHSNCHSSTAASVLKQRCDLMRACNVPASVEVFGDPCSEVNEKYIEIQYTCWSIPRNFV